MNVLVFKSQYSVMGEKSSLPLIAVFPLLNIIGENTQCVQ